MNRTTKRIGALGTAAVAVMGAGIAFAAWTTNGAGTGSATAGTAQDLTISSTALTGLYPTESLSDVAVTIDNANPYKVALSNLDLSDVTVTAAPNDPNFGGVGAVCTDTEAATDITSAGLALGTATDIVDATGSTEYDTFPLKVSNDLPNECKGASFTLHYTVDGSSTS